MKESKREKPTETKTRPEKGWKMVEGRWHRRFGDNRRAEVAALTTVYPPGVNAVENGGDGEDWEELEIAVDSWATETVIPETELPGVALQEGEAYRRGVRYEVADGDLIPNLGEKIIRRGD